MNEKTLLSILGLALNVAVMVVSILCVISIFVEIPGFGFAIDIGNDNPFKYLAFISILGLILVSPLSIVFFLINIKKEDNVIPGWHQVIKLIFVTLSAIMMVVSIISFVSDKNVTTYSVSTILCCIVIPVISIVSFILFEVINKIKWPFTLLSVIPAIGYILFYVIYAASNPETGDWYEYGLYKSGSFDTPLAVFLVILFVVVSIVISQVMWILNLVFRRIFIGYEIEVEPAPNNVQKEAIPAEGETSASQEEGTIKKTRRVFIKNAKYEGGARVYHISRTGGNKEKWKVKLARGDKALKTFDTQLEAIEYAKNLLTTQGGSIRIHSMKGQIRK